MATTVGLLHPGEMGSVVGECLRAGGARVVWPSAGRSERHSPARQGGRPRGPRHAGGRGRRRATWCSPCAPRGPQRTSPSWSPPRGSGASTSTRTPSRPRRPARRVRSSARRVPSSSTAASSGRRPARPGRPGSTWPARAPARSRACSRGPRSRRSWCQATSARPRPSRWRTPHGRRGRALSSSPCARWRSARVWTERCAPSGSAPRRASKPARSRRVAANARKAWRFVGEMEEIAATFAAAGLPAGLPRGVRCGLRPARPVQGRAGDAVDGRSGRRARALGQGR